jgi:hypothetical protein
VEIEAKDGEPRVREALGQGPEDPMGAYGVVPYRVAEEHPGPVRV